MISVPYLKRTEVPFDHPVFPTRVKIEECERLVPPYYLEEVKQYIDELERIPMEDELNDFLIKIGAS